MGQPNSMVHEFDFWDNRYEGRRLFSEVLGTFFLVLVAAGSTMVDHRFPGSIPLAVQVTVPGMMVAAIILFMGAVSGAHLNPAVTLSFALRGDFPWRRVPAYLVAEFLGASLGALLLWGLLGKFGTAGLTLPGHGVTNVTALLTEVVLTVGLVSVILGTASGAQQIGPIAALGVGFYIALAGLWAAPVSGASMNPAGRSGRHSCSATGPRGGCMSWGPSSEASSLSASPTCCEVRAVARSDTCGQGALGSAWTPETIGNPDPAPSGPNE